MPIEGFQGRWRNLRLEGEGRIRGQKKKTKEEEG
jgi:hypothetical protein